MFFYDTIHTKKTFYKNIMIDFLITNALNILYLALSFFLIVVAFLLIPILFRLSTTLKNINKLTTEIQDTLELFQNYLWQPARLMIFFKSGAKNIINIIKGFLNK